MRSKISFDNKVTQYLGRNGIGKCTGIELLDARPLYHEVWISPINSKDNVARCQISVPVEDIPEIIKALQEMAKA